MSNKDKAEIILEALDEYIQVDWNFKGVWFKAIINGLEAIDEKEKENERNSLTANDKNMSFDFLGYVSSCLGMAGR